MKHCPRCSSEISKNDKVCPRCGLPTNQIEEYEKKFNIQPSEEEVEEEPKISKKELKKNKKEEKKLQKKAKKEEKKKLDEEKEVDFAQFATNSGIEDPDEILDTDTYSERRKKKKKLQAKPRFNIDENGEWNIDTSDVEIVGEEAGRTFSQQYEQSYSIKKSRGDYIPPKIKWWEIYKFTDRHFARAKIKKEVNKAAKIRPSFVKKSTLLLLAIFLGWTGAHNFYARNKRKGWFTVFTLVTWVSITMLATSVKFFSGIEISIGGFAGFITLFIWASDVINIIFNQFKYRFQIDRFISGLNVETRAKLGEKYIDLDLYHKPWWVRLRAWFEKTKRNHQERKRERRQANIEKQKRKQAQQEEKAKIEKAIAEFEAREERGEDDETISPIIDNETLSEIKTFEDEENSDEDSETENEDDSENDDQTEETLSKKNTTNSSRKYAKTVKNKKAANKKKKR